MSSSRGICLVISSPSGGGKTSVINGLVASLPRARHSLSYTTRSCRSEKDAGDYHFITAGEFMDMVDRDEFLEWAEVHGNLYGTRRSDLMDLLESGHDALLDIDVQGAVQIRQRFPDAVFIFIIPPSWEELEKRLRNRGSEDPTTVEKRLRNARSELLHIWNYDYVVTNDDLQKAILQIHSILNAERSRIHRFQPSSAWLGLLDSKEES